MSKKAKNGGYSSHDWIQAMLEAKLDGNAMKIVLAYLQVGGWQEGTDVFLTRKDYEAYGLSRATISRWRVVLIELGWLVPTGRVSEKQYPYYLIQMGASYCGRGSLNVTQGVTQNEAGGASDCGTEVTSTNKEVINEETTKEATPHSSVVPPSESSFLNIKDKDDVDGSSLIGKNVPVSSESPSREEVPNKGVPQIEAGELDWDTPYVPFRERMKAGVA